MPSPLSTCDAGCLALLRFSSYFTPCSKESKRKEDQAYQLRDEAEAKARKAEDLATRAMEELSQKVQAQLQAVMQVDLFVFTRENDLITDRDRGG